MPPVTLYAGLCQGGPFDGKPLYHGEPVKRQAIEGLKARLWVGPETEEIRFGEYRHDGDKWIWNPPPDPVRE